MRTRWLLFGLILTAQGLCAWQWPTDAPTVVATFGQSAGTAYQRGITLGGGVQPVFPVAAGTVIYVRSDRDVPALASGTTVVVEHDRGFRSVYAHLLEGSTPEPGTPVTEETQIGLVGQTGMTASPRLRLDIIDTSTGVYVNPLILLPELPDPVDPQITSLYAQSDSAFYDLGPTSTVPAGEYELLVECIDGWTARAPDRGAPYALLLVVDGQERASITFDNISYVEGEARVQPGPAIGHDELYAGTNLYRLDAVIVPVGRTIVEIIVEDYKGNRATSRVEMVGVP